MPWLFLAVALLSSHVYSFYKGYQWASKDYVIRQQTAKLKYIDVTRGYYRNAYNVAKDETDKATQRMEASEAKLKLIEDKIRAGAFKGKACSQELFESIR